jgi:hypothetical protein
MSLFQTCKEMAKQLMLTEHHVQGIFIPSRASSRTQAIAFQYPNDALCPICVLLNNDANILDASIYA